MLINKANCDGNVIIWSGEMRHCFTYLFFSIYFVAVISVISYFCIIIFGLSYNSYKFAFGCKILHKRHVINMLVPSKLTV